MSRASYEDVKRIMQEIRRRRDMPSSERIVDETFKRLGYVRATINPESVLAEFNQMLRRLWEETLVTMEAYEDGTYSEGIPRAFVDAYPKEVAGAEAVTRRNGFAAGVIYLLSRWYPRLRRAFQSVGQGRMARGGKDFELQIQGLFDLAEIPYEKQEARNHTDFVLPSAAFHSKNRTAAAIISVKRTLRERWAEVAEELFNLRTPNVFLFTADEDVREMHLKTICDRYNIHLVVWDAVKTKFEKTPMVLSYSQWASERLRLLSQFWPKTGHKKPK